MNCSQLKNFRVASFPARVEKNPYIDLFYDALAFYGVELSGELMFTKEWINENSKLLNGIHIHWPEPIWRSYIPYVLRRLLNKGIRGSWYVHQHTKSIRKLQGIIYLWNVCRLTKRLGIRVIWTFHNIEHHEGTDILDRLGYRILASASDLIIFHSEFARQEFRTRYKSAGQLVLMPHGNYEGVYPPPRSRNEVLRELGLDSQLPVVCCLGALRNYKGLDIACRAIAMLAGEVQFICGGEPHRDFDLQILRNELAKIPGTILIPRSLSNQEFADLACASDAVLLPYRKITGSGVLLAALTLGRGVIASDLPYFREILSLDPTVGVLVKPENAEALVKGIREYLRIPADIRDKAINRLSKQYNWTMVVKPVIDIIDSWKESNLKEYSYSHYSDNFYSKKYE